MRQIRKELGEDSTHEGASMVVINVITHGGRDGHLCSAGKGHGLHIPDLIGTLTDVEALRGKPKIFFFNSCRGGEAIYSSTVIKWSAVCQVSQNAVSPFVKILASLTVT